MKLQQADGYWVGTFKAMASPCEVLMEVDDRQDARHILSIVSTEAERIERKFSRYLPGNVIHRINNSNGHPIDIDDETARLLDFAGTLHELSGGKFDITSGALRLAWTFDGSDRIPYAETIQEALLHVGWDRVSREEGRIRLEPGMEIDFGGIGKEYAVDQAAALVSHEVKASCLVNLGGDSVVTGPRRRREPWRVGIENPDGHPAERVRIINLVSGGLATSGDSHRFLMKDGQRLSHILDPTTGWPVRNAPRSVTVAAPTCVQAGMVSTLAMLQGAEAEGFLDVQGLRHWVTRDRA